MRIALRSAVPGAVCVLLAFAGSDAGAQGGPTGCDGAPVRASIGTAAITAYPDVPLFAHQFGEETVSGPPLAFRTRLLILPAPRRGTRVLVKMADRARCGYVESSRVLSGSPLQVADVDPEVRTGIFGGVHSAWTIKAILRSNPRLDAMGGEATLFDAPGGMGKPHRTSRVFGLFNVFKVDKRGDDPGEWWYFVGGRKVADDKVVSGWVRGGNLFFWSSGMAVYPAADKRVPFDVYTDMQTLQKGDRAGLIATRSGLEPPPDRDIAKFPILDQVFKTAGGGKDGSAPIAIEIGFIGAAKLGKGALAKAGELPVAQLVDVSALKDGVFKRLGLTAEEAERVLNLRQLVTRGYVGYDAQKRGLAFFAAMEPARFRLFQGSMAEVCRALNEGDDLRARMLGLMLTLAHNLGGDPYKASETIAGYLDRIVLIPKRHFASWLDTTASQLGSDWDTASAERKAQLRLSACRSAYLLQQMGAGHKVQSMDDLQFDAGLGQIRLKAGRELRSYTWLWSTESGIELYFVPTAYLPQD